MGNLRGQGGELERKGGGKGKGVDGGGRRSIREKKRQGGGMGGDISDAAAGCAPGLVGIAPVQVGKSARDENGGGQ